MAAIARNTYFSNLIFQNGFLEFWKKYFSDFPHFLLVEKAGRGEDTKLKISAKKKHSKHAIFK